jgi:hypothetical protein
MNVVDWHHLSCVPGAAQHELFMPVFNALWRIGAQQTQD